MQSKRVLVYVFDRCMRLLHPFMPFLTETLWQLTPHRGDSLMAAAWPVEGETALHVDTEAVAAFGAIQALVRAIRNARAEYVLCYTIYFSLILLLLPARIV